MLKTQVKTSHITPTQAQLLLALGQAADILHTRTATIVHYINDPSPGEVKDFANVVLTAVLTHTPGQPLSPTIQAHITALAKANIHFQLD